MADSGQFIAELIKELCGSGQFSERSTRTGILTAIPALIHPCGAFLQAENPSQSAVLITQSQLNFLLAPKNAE